MNILPNIVVSLNKEEIRNFKLFINRTNSNKNRKDENLFDLIKNSYPDKYDEDKLFKKLYGEDSQWKKLIPSSIAYNGKFKHYALFIISWLWQKWNIFLKK